jgi:hypothetical protein
MATASVAPTVVVAPAATRAVATPVAPLVVAQAAAIAVAKPSSATKKGLRKEALPLSHLF